MPAHRFKYLIADTSAFINNKTLQEIAENVLTIPDVMREIKNQRQIRRLVTLPYELKVEEPFPENVQFVIDFAKKTGDYLSLSAVDVKVIALTYQFEKQHIGSNHLKTEPVKITTIHSKDKPIELLGNTEVIGFYNSTKNDDESSGEEDDEQEEYDEDSEVEEADKIEIAISDDINKLNIKGSEITEEDILVLVKEASEEKTDTDGDIDENEDEENNDGWITPANVKNVKKSFGLDIREQPTTEVACMSTDYAIQNVLKQIGLNVASFDGKVIKEMRTYILRCYACFKTTSILTKVFCPNCGNKSLKRVAVSLDENGKQVVHVNLRRPLTAKGKNKSLPRFRGGKHSCNPILFEDQPLPKQMPTRVARTKTNALEDDYIAGYSPFAVRDTDSRSAILRGKSNIKQLMANNSYDNNRRYMKK